MGYKIGQRAAYCARPDVEYRITDVSRMPDGVVFTLSPVKRGVPVKITEHELSSALWQVG